MLLIISFIFFAIAIFFVTIFIYAKTEGLQKQNNIYLILAIISASLFFIALISPAIMYKFCEKYIVAEKKGDYELILNSFTNDEGETINSYTFNNGNTYYFRFIQDKEIAICDVNIQNVNINYQSSDVHYVSVYKNSYEPTSKFIAFCIGSIERTSFETYELFIPINTN